MTTRWDAIASGRIRIPANDHLGFVLEPVADAADHVTFSWTVPAEYCNAEGNLQGGMLAAFADAALGAAASAHLASGEYPALAEMKISIYRPAGAGAVLSVTGRVVKKGRRVLFVESEITDSGGRLIAKASGTSLPATTSTYRVRNDT